MKYEQIFIKSKKDLPKNNGNYFVSWDGIDWYLLPLPSDDKQEEEQILHEFAEKFNMKSIHDDPELAEASGRAVNEMLHESVQSPSKESSEQERTEDMICNKNCKWFKIGYGHCNFCIRMITGHDCKDNFEEFASQSNKVNNEEPEEANLNKLTSDELFKLVKNAESKYKKLLKQWSNSLYDNKINKSHNYSSNNTTSKSEHGRRHVGCGKPGGSKRH